MLIVYVAKLVPGQKLTFDVGFTDPDVRASSRPVDLTVADAPTP